ncbi:MAG TPA: ABC transporter permease [Candidatus Angelobacter sp.]
MESLVQDIRFGLRMLRKNPGFATVAVLVLAIGIGANTAIFSVINAALLHPLPYPDSERLVVVEGLVWDRHIPLSYPELLAWRDQKEIFEDAAAFINSGFGLTGAGEPEQLLGMSISADLLKILGVKPEAGRNLLPQEDARTANPVAMITHSFWESHFHSSPSAIGQKLTLNDKVFTIVGILPKDFMFAPKAQLFSPLRLDATVAPSGLNFLAVMAKLRPGISLAQARNAMATALPRLQKVDANTVPATVTPYKEFLVGDSKPLLFILLGAVVSVMLIACANTANLLLARASSRRKEIAMRISLGASRFRLIRQLLTESLLVALIGGVFGLFLAWAGMGLLTTLLAERLPRGTAVHMDATVLLFTAILAVVTGIVFGLAPSLQIIKGNLQAELKQGGAQTGGVSGSQWLRQALIVSEIAFSLVLLAGAGLLLRSFVRLLNVDKGFSTDHVLTMGIWPSPVRYADPKLEINYLQQIQKGVGAMPGIRSAGFVTNLPLTGRGTDGGFSIQGRPDDPTRPVNANKQFVGGDYLQALRVPLIKGRYFTEADISGAPAVVIIDQTFAKEYFPGEDPIGKHLDVGWGNPGWSEIVGVVGDAKLDSLSASAHPTFYAPFAQKPEIIKFLSFALVVRSSQDPLSIAQTVRSQIHQIDPNQVISAMRSMDQVMVESLAPRRAPMWLMGLFSSIALFLAAIGIYGVLSYYVLQRRQEIGLRMALGAQRKDVLRMVVLHAARLVIVGVGIGLIAAFLTSRALTSLLFGVKPTDTLTYAGVSFVLALIAITACAIPALRATQVDPLVVLRNE